MRYNYIRDIKDDIDLLHSFSIRKFVTQILREDSYGTTTKKTFWTLNINFKLKYGKNYNIDHGCICQ